jgi:[protein-PII] uridylyltransferase
MATSGTSTPELPSEIILPSPESSGELGAVALGFIQELREKAHDYHRGGASGTAVVDYFTKTFDGLIRFLFEAAACTWRTRYVQGGEELAILAQGGYGRAELNPYSDIDLLILLPHKVTPFAEATTESILYALWDARVQVGHAVRNSKDCARLAATDLKIKTSLLDARYLCGSETLFAQFDQVLQRDIVSKTPSRFFREKLEESHNRHEEFGDSVYLLEPQIKEGRGGLRDYHTAMWLSKVHFGIRAIEDLVSKDVLTAGELVEILGARDYLFRTRNSLHFLTSSHADQLTFDLQDRVASDLGYGEVTEHSFAPVENFLGDYYRNASVITGFAERVVESVMNPTPSYRLLGKVMARTIRPGVQIINDALEVSPVSMLRKDPVEMLRVVRDAQRHGVKLAASLQSAIREHGHLIGEQERADPRVAENFLAILRSPWRVYETVHQLHRLRLLERVLPEWEHLVCLVRRNHFHIYTVDEHSLMGIRELERLRRGDLADELPLLTEVMREDEDCGLLFLAMMLHDAGKGLGGDHSEIGEQMAGEIGRRLGLDEDFVAELQFLVRNHLVLALFAEQRDMNDEKTALELARLVGAPETLRRLFLLTYGDMRATNPKMWNQWKDLLLSEAYLRSSEVFARGFEPEDRALRVERIRARALAAAGEAGGVSAKASLEGFLAQMDDSYLIATPEASFAAHAALVVEAERNGLAWDVTHVAERGFTEFTVVLPDRDGLFAILTGALAAFGMSVLTARISTTRGGLALDSFRISHADAAELTMEDERWTRLVEFLGEVLSGEADLGARLLKVRDGGLRRRKQPSRAITTIVADADSSEENLLLDVYAPDRVGLLHRVAEALHELGLKVHLAKIATNVGQAVDIFFVRELDGRKPTRENEIRESLMASLESFEAEFRDSEALKSASGASGSR